ncbi:MAG: 4'-phosphopantetheinyl transferase superfamily protein [Psychroflexus sp.]
MIGNDIVDLNLARTSSNIFRPRYFDKILNTSELNFIQKSQNKFLCFWRIWTLKETAYKAFQRHFLFDDFYNPSLFSSEIINSELALVSFRNQTLEIKSETNSSYIYSWTKAENIQENIIGNTKAEVFEKLNKALNLASFSLKKDKKALPYSEIFHKKTPISNTHHGQFYAIII